MSVTDKGVFFLSSAESIDATSEFIEVVLSSDAFNVTIIYLVMFHFTCTMMMFRRGGL